MIIGNSYSKRFNINNVINNRSYVIKAEVFDMLVLAMIITQNKYFGLAALLFVFIRITGFIALVKSKLALRWRALSVDLSSTLPQTSETSETEMPLGAASRQADGNLLTQRDPKKWLLH